MHDNRIQRGMVNTVEKIGTTKKVFSRVETPQEREGGREGGIRPTSSCHQMRVISIELR